MEFYLDSSYNSINSKPYLSKRVRLDLKVNLLPVTDIIRMLQMGLLSWFLRDNSGPQKCLTLAVSKLKYLYSYGNTETLYAAIQYIYIYIYIYTSFMPARERVWQSLVVEKRQFNQKCHNLPNRNEWSSHWSYLYKNTIENKLLPQRSRIVIFVAVCKGRNLHIGDLVQEGGVVSPLLTHWRYCSFILSLRNIPQIYFSEYGQSYSRLSIPWIHQQFITRPDRVKMRLVLGDSTNGAATATMRQFLGQYKTWFSTLKHSK